MRRSKKTVLAVCILLLCCCVELPVSAKPKDVTKKYKNTVTKMLAPFDRYLCSDISYDEGKVGSFVFNDYAKTSMMIYSSVTTVYHNERISSVRRKCVPQMKLYFGSDAKFKLKKFIGYGGYNGALQYLIQKRNGRLWYAGGEYADMDTPKGKVTKIVRLSKKRYKVTYKEYMTNEYYGFPKRYRGTFQVYLQKAKNKFGFVIKDIKLTKTAPGRLHW